MNVNPISFTGLWVKKSSETEASTYEYRPFADESNEEAQKVVDSFNGKTMRIFDTDDDLGYNDYFTKLDVKMGERLNITTADYKTASANTPVEQARTLRYSAELVQLINKIIRNKTAVKVVFVRLQAVFRKAK